MRPGRAASLLAAAALCAACGSTAPPSPRPAPARSGAPPGASGPSGPPARPAIPPAANLAPEPTIRVGLQTDAPSFALPSPGTPWTLAWAGGRRIFYGPLSFAPQEAPLLYRVQIGAFTERPTADRIARSESAALTLPATTVFAADKGVYQVRLGSFADPAAARAARDRIAAQGNPDAFVVPEASAPTTLRVRDGNGAVSGLPAAADVLPPEGALAEDAGREYRGFLRILVNPRGLLNVVNVVNLEDYLRGVVPAEMGPRRFDEIEALKAQAVAARTYALAERGKLAREGYDLCATPKCQVYGGVAVEDPLSDAAVGGTSGLVLAYQGRLIHALFTSTCGGHTEDASKVFPDMDAPYLKGVSCGPEQPSLLVGRRTRTDAALSALEWRGYVLETLAASGRRAPARAAVWKEALALAGLPPRRSPPFPATAGAAYRAILDGFGLGGAARLQASPLDPPAPGARGLGGMAYEAFLRLNLAPGVALPPPSAALSARALSGILLSCVLRLGGVTETDGRFVRREGGELLLKTAAGRESVPADASMILARGAGGYYFPAPQLALYSGDPVALLRRGDTVIAFAALYEPERASFESGSAWTTWVRRFSGRELAMRVGARAPGATDVREISVLERGASGRVLSARLVTDAGAFTVSGFDLRQALGLPELVFAVEPARGARGEGGFVFLGRGWGHGVGLCQNGAYGMALSGSTFDEILKHYYTGVDIVPLSTLPAGAR